MVKIDLNYPVLRESNIMRLKLHDRGKVRDIYLIGDDLGLLATDRISTHDVVYEDCIPHKGFGLTATPIYVFEMTRHIVPNHFISSPDPNFMIVQKAETYPVELVIRGIITGSAWRDYQANDGVVCGIKLPKGLKKNQMLEAPIITPATKAKTGHDINITDEQARDLVGPIWDEIKRVSLALYGWGCEKAAKNNAIIPDTKFEYGKRKGLDLLLLDEALTHDSSRYLKKDEWERAFMEGVDPDWIDKQYVRNHVESLGFRGDGPAPRLPDHVRQGAAERVFKVYELLTGNELSLPDEPPTNERIERNLRHAGLI